MKNKFKIEETNSQNNPFRVPEGYFDSLTERIMSNIPEETNNVVEMTPKKNRTWIGWASGIAAALIGAVIWFAVPSSDKGDNNSGASTIAQAEEYTSETEYAQDALEYAMIDYDDIYAYMSDQSY